MGDKGRANSIAIRVPDSVIDIALMEETGPLVVTSANPSGGIDVFDWFESAFDMALKHADCVGGILTGGFAPSFGSETGDSPASTVLSFVDFDETPENSTTDGLPLDFKIGSEFINQHKDLVVLRHGCV